MGQKIKSYQIRSNLVEILRKVVDRLNFSSQTYYHSIFLFNLVKLEKERQNKKASHFIPLKKQNRLREKLISQQNFQKNEGLKFQMLEKDKLDMITCLFLAQKIYDNDPICSQNLMRQFGIEKRGWEYVLKLEVQILVLLKFKIQNLLPSHETLFACQDWDQFIQKISDSCVDVKFGIRWLLQKEKVKVFNFHPIKQTQIEPEFKNIESQQNFKMLIKNLDILVHNKSLYELYLQKSIQKDQNLHPMKKIGLAIMYVTILQQSNMIFSKRYNKDVRNSPTKDSKFLDFVFNDFLQSQYRLSLENIYDEIFLCRLILNQASKNKDENRRKICSVNSLDKVQQKNLLQFLLKVKEKPKLQLIRSKFKENASQTETQTQSNKKNIRMINICKKDKCDSISNIIRQEKALDSTVYRSTTSQTGQNELYLNFRSKQKNGIRKNYQNSENILKTNYVKKSQKVFTNSQKLKLSQKITMKHSASNKKKSINLTNYLEQNQQYLVSHFAPIQI